MLQTEKRRRVYGQQETEKEETGCRSSSEAAAGTGKRTVTMEMEQNAQETEKRRSGYLLPDGC